MSQEGDLHPTLKVAVRRVIVARKGNLRLLPLELLQDLLVRDVALLVVLVNNQPPFVANPAFNVWHQGIASAVGLADIAIYALPTMIAVAGRAFPGWPLVAHGQRAAQRFGTVVSTPSWRTYASPVGGAAVGKLVALKVLEVAVETRWTVVGPIFVLEVV